MDEEYFADYQAFYQIKRQHFKNKPFLGDIRCTEYIDQGACTECGRTSMYYVRVYVDHKEMGMLCTSCSTKDMNSLECVRSYNIKNDTSPLPERENLQ